MFILLTFFFLLNLFNILFLIYKFYVQYKNNKNKIKWNNFYNLLYLNNLKKYLSNRSNKNNLKKCFDDLKNYNKNKMNGLLKYKIVVCDLNFLLKNKIIFNSVSFFCKNNNIKLYVIGDAHPDKFKKIVEYFKFYDQNNYISPYHYYKNFFNQIYKSEVIQKNRSEVCKNHIITDLLDENKFNENDFITILQFVKNNNINHNISIDSFNNIIKKKDYNSESENSSSSSDELNMNELNPKILLEKKLDNWTEIN